MVASKPRRLAVMLALALLAAPASRPARADQADPRLPRLFADLKSAPDFESSQPLAAQIWAIWGQSGDAATDALMQAGAAALAGQDFPAALEAFSAATGRSPGFAEAWNKRATTLYAMGRIPESLADIATVLRLEPRHFGALSGLGLCDVRQGRLEAAVADFQRALAVNPNMPAVRENIRNLQRLIARQSI